MEKCKRGLLSFTLLSKVHSNAETHSYRFHQRIQKLKHVSKETEVRLTRVSLNPRRNETIFPTANRTNME